MVELTKDEIATRIAALIKKCYTDKDSVYDCITEAFSLGYDVGVKAGEEKARILGKKAEISAPLPWEETPV